MYLPDPRFELPELLYPGRKPTGPVVIDWDHPLAKGLVFCSEAGTAPATEYGANVSIEYVHPFGMGYDSTSTANSGVHWPADGMHEMLSGKDTLTILTWLRIDDIATYSALVTVPYSTTHTSPYHSLGLIRYSGSSQIYLANENYDSGDNRSNDILLVNDGLVHCYGVTRAKTSMEFYRDGTAMGLSVDSMGTVPQLFTNKLDVHSLDRNSQDQGEGVDGAHVMTLIYDRPLPDAEIQSVYRNPFQFFLPG